MAERGKKPDRILLSKRVYRGAIAEEADSLSPSRSILGTNAERARRRQEELLHSMDLKVFNLVQKKYFLTYGQVKEWLDFCREMEFDSGRTSLFLFEFSELNPWRTKNINRPEDYKMGYEEWRRRRRRPVL